MKKNLIVLLIIISCALLPQESSAQHLGSLKISQQKCLKRKGYSLVLKEVVSDSRCPEGVTCVWAGEVKFKVDVYHDKKLLEDGTFTLSPLHKKENYEWFAKYLPIGKSRIKNINVLPYPKDGVKLKAEDYYLKVEYLK